MFRKLTAEQSEAVAIFLSWIIAGMAFAILSEGIKARLFDLPFGLSWVPPGVAFVWTWVQSMRSKLREDMLFMVVVGAISGTFGSKGILGLVASVIVFRQQVFFMSLTMVTMLIVGCLIVKNYVKATPEFLLRKKEADALANKSIEDYEAEYAGLSELETLDLRERRILQPPIAVRSPAELMLPIFKQFAYAFLSLGAVLGCITTSAVTEKFKLCVVAAFGIAMIEWLHRFGMPMLSKRILDSTIDWQRFETETLEAIRERRAELLRKDT
ncbi:MAG: hypothetical protein WCK51_00190 [Armatimonadota bacterium]